MVRKSRTVWFYNVIMNPKDADGMSSSIHPDQTAVVGAVLSWSAVFAWTYLSQYLEFLW